MANILYGMHIELIPCAWCVPQVGDIFLAKTGKLMRCKIKNYSKRAKARFIVYRSSEPTMAKIVHSANDLFECRSMEVTK